MTATPPEPTPAAPKRRLTWRKKLLFSGILLGITLLGCEVALRLAGISYPLPYRSDPHCGSRLVPDFRGWFTKEGRAWVTTNSDGNRDREHARDKPAGVRRVAILGDSFCEAVQVEFADTFWHRWEQSLDSAAVGRTTQVLNFGVSGYGTGQEYQFLEHYAWDFAPDIVLVAFFPENDLINNSADLDPDLVKPFFTLGDGRLQRDDRFLEHPVYLRASSPWGRAKTWAINHSHLLQLARETRLRWRQGRPQTVTEIPPAWECYREPVTSTWQSTWRVTEALFRELDASCRRHGAQLVILVVSTPLQVHPDPAPRQSCQTALEVADLWYPCRRMQAFGESLGCEVLCPAYDMQAEALASGAFFHGFANTELGTGHWNSTGHAYVANWLTRHWNP